MTSPRAFGFVIIAGAGILGVFLGRAVPHDASGVAADASGSPTSPGTTPADDECEAERSALASTRAKLELCMAMDTAEPEAAPSSVPETPEPEPPASNVEPTVQEIIAEEIRSYHGRLDSLPEAVIVQEADGTIGIHKPDDGPIDGDGLIIGRKLPSGEIGWYAGPDAGPRSDPAAFRPTKSVIVFAHDFVREADGAIRVRRGAPAWIKRRLGERVDEPASP
ncbi:hypothetical protein WME79_19735 [Sorangium sp. So ce726]|uniref:hypothetical protein n=1 Tax=Sorangium sp. So ce726 TaxID=3133319 RepID=UPI003F63516C